MSFRESKVPSREGPPELHGVTFAEWRQCFFEDARRHGLLHNAELLNDTALRLFWQEGIAPTVRALLSSADGGPSAA